MTITVVEQRARWHPRVRQHKARKIIAILESQLGENLDRLRCLDLGCSSGVISAALSERFGAVVGVDIDQVALKRAVQTGRSNLYFLAADASCLPFASESFDVVVCAQVYEHVSAQAALFEEIHRVLKRDGACFFSGPNKLAPIEAHCGLPFVHWLPKPFADSYIRLLGKGHSYDERPLSYWRIRELARDFTVTDYTVKIIRNPARYSCDDEVRPVWVSRIPERILRSLFLVFPNYNWVLRKRS